MRSGKYSNGVTTVLVALLGLMVVERVTTGPSGGVVASLTTPRAAQAGPDDEPSAGLVSAADQRKLMLAELKRLSAQLDRLESRLASGINVKVTDMPAIKLPKE